MNRLAAFLYQPDPDGESTHLLFSAIATAGRRKELENEGIVVVELPQLL